MDRRIVYSGQLAYETDMLLTNKFAMLGVSYLAQAILGNSPVQVYGLNCTPDPDPLQPFRVVVGPGQVYAMAPIDATSYGGAIDEDIAHEVKKQGILADSITFNCPKPAVGKSIYYLIEVAFQEVDEEPATLLYYNSANPSIPFTGPGNNGQQQNTVRRGKCDVRLVTGVAADSGSEVVPSADPGFIGIWTIRVSGNTTNITAAGSSTSDGIWMVNPGIRIAVGGGSGGLDQETADGRYARLAFANTFTNAQTISFNNPTPLIVQGGQTTAGTGVKIIGDGETTPSKTVRVRGGVFGIQNHVQNPTDILTLDDSGNLAVTGRISCTDPSGAVDSQVATVGWCNGRFALTGEGGFITQSDGDNRYIRKDGGASDPQTIQTQLNVASQSGYTYVGLPDNHVATARWVREHFATAAASGITQDQGDLRYVRQDSTDQSIGGVKTFNGKLRTTTNPTGDNTADVVPFGYAESRYAKLNANVTFGKVALTDSNPGADDAIRRSFADGRYLMKDGGGGTQTLSNGTVNASGISLIVKSNASGNEAIGFSQVQSMITAATGGSGNFAVKNAANTFTAANTFQGSVSFTGGATFSGTCPSSSVSPTGANDLVRLQYLQNQYMPKSGGAFSGQISVPNGTLSGHAVNLGQLGEYVKRTVTNEFTARQDFTAIRINSVAGTHRIEFGGSQYALELNGTGFQFKNSGADLFTVNGLGTVVAGSSLKVGNTGLGAVTAGAGNFSGAVAAGAPTGNTSVPRLVDHGFQLGNSGYVDIPIWSGGQMRKIRIVWGRSTLGTSFTGGGFVQHSWAASLAAIYHVQATLDHQPAANQREAVYARNATTSGVEIYSSVSGLGVWVIGVGLAPA